MKEGFCYIVYGERARISAEHSLMTLRQRNDRPIHCVGDQRLTGATFTEFPTWGMKGRWAKLNLDLLSPFPFTCYLDADTIIHSDLSIGFSILRDGWDMVICPSANQGDEWLGHIGDREKHHTLECLGERFLQLQAGVIWFNGERCRQLFRGWRSQWRNYKREDQGALLRALYSSPLKIWLLGHPWSNGEMVRHLHGHLR